MCGVIFSVPPREDTHTHTHTHTQTVRSAFLKPLLTNVGEVFGVCRRSYEVWSPTIAASDSEQGGRFNLTLNLRIPTSEVLYTPTASEVLKDAWVKYLALFLVVLYLADQFSALVFFYQLVETTVLVETPHNKRGVKTNAL